LTMDEKTQKPEDDEVLDLLVADVRKRGRAMQQFPIDIVERAMPILIGSTIQTTGFSVKS